MKKRRPFCAGVSVHRGFARRARHDPRGRGILRARGALSLALLAATACLAAPLHAQSATVSGAVAVSSQLVDRGQAVTPATPILQAAVSWAPAPGWSLGLSGGTEIRSPGHVSEALAQVSHYWSLSSDWQMQGDLLYYDYPGNAQARLFDRTEIGVNWIYRDILTFGLSGICLINGTRHEPRGAADINFHWPLAWHFSLSLGAGVSQSLVLNSGSYGYGERINTAVYRYGHAGLLWSYGPWRVELDRVATNPAIPRHAGNLVTAPWVGTISWSF